MHNTRAFVLVCAGLVCLAAARPASAQCQTGLRPIGVGNATIPFQYVVGQEYALVEGLGTSNYQFLDFSQMDPPIVPPYPPCFGGSGAAFLRCMVENGLDYCVGVNQSIRVQTGVVTGTVETAIDAIFNSDVVASEYSAALNDAYAAYLAAGGNGSRVLPLPLVAFVTSPTNPTPCVGGNNCWGKVNTFSGFFLKRRFTSGAHTFYGEFVPIPEAPVPTARSTWGTVKLMYR